MRKTWACPAGLIAIWFAAMPAIAGTGIEWRAPGHMSPIVKKSAMAALVPPFFSGPVGAISMAAGQAVGWSGVGWYVLPYDGVGWVEISAGPYPDETACEVEADRHNAAKTDYMILFMCRHLNRPPISDGDGGILIWIPDA